MTDALSAFVLPNLVFTNLAFTGGILAVLALRKPVRTQFGAKMAYALWLVPLLVLAASFLPPRVINIVQNAPMFEAMPSGPEYVLPAAPVEAAPAAPVFTAAAKPAFDPLLAALVLWITGAIAMFAWLGRRQALFMTDVRKGTAGPAVIGVFRPRIVTPADFEARFDASEQRVIITHETIHLARQDARINALVALIRCICWYNPLVHIGAHAMRIDQELACDAAVVERHPKARRLYADALLKAQLAARPLPLGCYWPAGREHPLMERIEMLKHSAPGQLRRVAGLALLITLTAAAATAAWAAMPPTTRIVYQDPQQSPAPARTQQVDYSWENSALIRGKVVAVNLAGSPPTVQVQGALTKGHASILPPPPGSVSALEPGDQAEQVWTIDLTPKGRAPTQDRDLNAAKIGAMVDVLAYRVDKACTSNCLLWGRNFTVTRTPVAPRPSVVGIRGIPERFDTSFERMIRVDGQITSIVRSGSDNIITVRSTTVLRGPGGQSAGSSETGDWRFIQFNGANDDRNPFNSQAAVNLQIKATGLPEKDATCAAACRLAFIGSDIGVDKDGKPARFDASVFGKAYDAATMGPPADRHNDAPSPAAQPGFNPEDYVVVRGTVVRVEGGNPVKTFWVRASEINRNFEKTQANTDTWRVDRVIPPGGAAPAEVRTGMDIRVDGYVSTSCQPECRIQPMLIDLVQQQAGAEPLFVPGVPVAQPIRFQPQQVDRPNAVTIIGKLQRVELMNPTSYVWVQADTIIPNKPGHTQLEATNQLYRVATGPKDQAPDWATRQDAIGRRIKVIGFEPSDAPCSSTCELGAFDTFFVTGPAMTSWCKPVPWKAPGMWENCTPSPTPPGIPADFMPFAKYFDANKPMMVRGKPTSMGFFEGRPVLWMTGVEIQTGGSKEFTSDSREWGIVMGAVAQTPFDTVKLILGKDITVRGYGAKDTSCVPACLINARDITLPSGEKVFIGTATTPATVVQPPAQPAPAPPSPEPQKTEYRRDAAPLPDLIPFERYFDAKAPVLLKGWVRKIEIFEGHSTLMIEEIEAQVPGYVHVPARDVTITWRVVLDRLENTPSWARDPSLVGKVISVRGYSERDEKCQLECMMAGRDIYIGKETLPGWLVPRPPPPKPKPKPPI